MFYKGRLIRDGRQNFEKIKGWANAFLKKTRDVSSPDKVRGDEDYIKDSDIDG